VRLVVFDIDKDTETQTIRDIKEQEIYFGALPLMTARGTFIVNGTERVVVSQLHRSPGIFIDHDKGKTHSSGKLLYSARIIPLRGSWIDFEFDPKDILYVRIDRRRKFPVTLLLKALGYEAEELLRYVYPVENLVLDGDKIKVALEPELMMGREMPSGIKDPENNKNLVRPGKKMSRRALNRLADLGIDSIVIKEEEILGRYAVADIADPATGEVIIALNQMLDEECLSKARAAGITEIPTLYIDGYKNTTCFRDTMELDKVETTDEAIVDIYRKLAAQQSPHPGGGTHLLQQPVLLGRAL
jgi:DNA-directed RNA polymerase subunit beta